MATISTAVPPGAVASVFGQEFNYVNLREGLAGLPQVIAILATYDPLKVDVVPNEPIRVFTDTDTGDKFGFGFPAHLAAKQTLRKSGIVPVYIFPIEEAAGAVAADGSVLLSGTATSSGTISLYIAGQRIPVPVAKGALPADVAGDVIAAINASINSPTTALVNATPEQLDITSKYLGDIANDITIKINVTEQEKDAAPGGVSFVITDMASGAGTPTVTDALNNFGTTWVTHIVNTFGIDASVLAELSLFNEDERWDKLVNKFFRAFYGSVDDFTTITTITDALKLDRTNAVINYEGAYSLPLEMAALAVGQIASRNQNDPALPYTGLTLDGLHAGVTAAWSNNYVQRDAALKLGTGTVILENGVMALEDIAMHYHKLGEEPPAYRWAVDIAKIAQWAFSVDLNFRSDKWRGKILIDDTDIGVINPNARKPLDAVADIFKIAEAANAAAIITKPGTTKANTTASIDLSNPNRLNIQTLIVLSGATRIISLTTNFGFNFGALAD